jgi:hypothetical protein
LRRDGRVPDRAGALAPVRVAELADDVHGHDHFVELKRELALQVVVLRQRESFRPPLDRRGHGFTVA